MRKKEFIVCLFTGKSTFGNFIEEVEEDFVAPKQAFFFLHFLIIISEEPYLAHVCEGMTFLHLGHLCVKSCLLKLCNKG